MIDILSGGVTRGIVDAAYSVKAADSAMSQFELARARNDKGAMERAFGYATDFMGEAKNASEESQEALTENIRKAREEERIEQAEKLEKSREESAKKNDETGKGELKTNDAPEYIVDISPEGAKALENSGMVAAESKQPETQTEPVAEIVQTTGGNVDMMI